MSRPLFVLTSLAAIGSVLMSGSFFAFSTFVMKGLARMPPADGLRAMQAINAAVVPSLFVATFMGTALLALPILGLAGWSSAPSVARTASIAGSLLYLVGAFGITAACNVPRNEALALLDPTQASAAATWARYLSEWTAWNHVRTVASLLAAIAFAIALRAPAEPSPTR